MTNSETTVAISRRDWGYLNFLGWFIFVAMLTVTLNTYFHNPKPRDFVYFYSIGRILNEHPPEQLYQYNLQEKTFNSVFRREKGIYGPSPYPPFVAMFFRPFARLSYWTACWLWMAVTVTLYLAGLWLLTRQFARNHLLLQSLLFCFGLLFWPAIAWMVFGGQLSAIGFFSMSLALCLEDSERQFLSGLTLSICLYKPTLLVLILPMLLVTRRFKTLAGFGLGALVLGAATTWAVGPRIWLAYSRMSVEFAKMRLAVDLTNYVDITAFSSMLAHDLPIMRAVVLCAGAAAGAYLVWSWWLTRRTIQHGSVTAIWAATITWTLLLNVYVPVYDSVLVVISIIASMQSLRRVARLAFMLCVLLLASSYFSIAERTGVQIFSVMLAALGVLQLRVCYPKLPKGGDQRRCGGSSAPELDCSELVSV